MNRIPETFIDDLLNRVDILDIVDSRVKLKKAGKDYQACCPFHKEKSPSFTVSQDKQFYYCFGCGATGTAISFLMNYEHLNFVGAIESLARTAGVEVPKERTASPEMQKHQKLYGVLQKAQQHFIAQLEKHPNRQGAVSYLRNRGLTDTMMQQFGVGFAPPGWDNLYKRLGVSEEDRQLLLEAGLLSSRDDGDKLYDKFRDRIMFPIIDVRGRTIGFGGRIIASQQQGKQGGPKYLNSPETPVFHKGKELYGLYQALQARRSIEQLIVVEGYMDVISLAQFGVTNAVATLGTACGEDHLKLAFKYASEIIFCFDGDNAGRRAAKRALQNALPMMGDGKQIKFLFLPEGQDPDTLVRAVGAERFQEELAHATPLETFFFDAIGEGINTNTMEGRARISKLAAPHLNKLESGVFRELMFSQLAQRTGLGHDVLRDLMTEKPVDLSPTEPQPSPAKPAPMPREHAPPKHADDVVPEPPSYDPNDVPPPEAYWSDTLPSAGEEATASFQQPRAPKNDRIRLSPAKLATTILLDNPQLLQTIEDTSLPPSDAQDITLLAQLIDWLRTSPQSTFHSILGFWGGRYGMEAQRYLAGLVANRFLDSVRRAAPAFNEQIELSNALDRIRLEYSKNNLKAELASLSNLVELTPAQKERYRELLKLSVTASTRPN